MDSPGQNTWVDSLSHLQGIFQTQESNPGLLYCRWILYQLSHKGSPRILEWVAYPFSSGSLDPGIKLGSPALQENSLPTELSGNVFVSLGYMPKNRIAGHVIKLCLIFWGLANCPPQRPHHFIFPPAMDKRIPFLPYLCQYMFFSVFLIRAVIVCVKM